MIHIQLFSNKKIVLTVQGKLVKSFLYIKQGYSRLVEIFLWNL